MLPCERLRPKIGMQKPAYPTDSLARNDEKWPKFDMLPCERLRPKIGMQKPAYPTDSPARNDEK